MESWDPRGEGDGSDFIKPLLLSILIAGITIGAFFVSWGAYLFYGIIACVLVLTLVWVVNTLL